MGTEYKYEKTFFVTTSAESTDEDIQSYLKAFSNYKRIVYLSIIENLGYNIVLKNIG